MSLTRKPLKDRQKTDPDTPDVNEGSDEVATDITPERKEGEAVKRKMEDPSQPPDQLVDSLPPPRIPEKEVSPDRGAVEDRLESGMCQTWKRLKKGHSVQQCTVRPRNGHDKCSAHGTNRREIGEKDQASCEVCVTTIAKGSLKKHEESNRHISATEFAATKKLKKDLSTEPDPELEVPEPTKVTKIPRSKTPAQPQKEEESGETKPTPVYGQRGEFPTAFPVVKSLMHVTPLLKNLSETNEPILPKDYSGCFGLTSL